MTDDPNCEAPLVTVAIETARLLIAYTKANIRHRTRATLLFDPVSDRKTRKGSPYLILFCTADVLCMLNRLSRNEGLYIRMLCNTALSL